MGVKRKIKRALEEINATFKIAKVTSFSEAINTFRGKYEIQKMVKNGYHESPKAKKILLKKHETMIKYFEKTFGEYLTNYDFNQKLEEGNSEYSKNIWVCWWQGLDKAPEIVKACIESIRRNSGGHPVVIITEKNYKYYVDIPEWVEEKRDKGIISRTNLSDLLRFSLLSKHGGMWLDSTFFATGDISKYFENDVWSIKRPDYLHCSVACGMFAGYSLCCNYDSRWIFKPMKDFFLHYWENNNKLVDYLLVDYMVVLCEKYSPRINDKIKAIKPNNMHCDDLCNILNEKYDVDKWNRIKEDTLLYKLTWKGEFIKNDTFYEKILTNNLE